MTMTARLRERSVVLVRAWSSSGVTSWRKLISWELLMPIARP